MIKKFLTLSCLLFLTVGAVNSSSFDYLLLNGRVFDGKDLNEKSVDIAIKGDRIAKIGNLKDQKAARVLDLKGLIVQPGIIDAHTHSDFTSFTLTPALSREGRGGSNFIHAITQGVTTIIVGNCGMGAFPVTEENRKLTEEIWQHEGVAMPEGFGAKDFKEYSALVESTAPAVNIAALIAHGNIRNFTTGGIKPEPLTAQEIQAEIEILKTDLSEGALGLSLGLAYLPGIYADETELSALARAIAGQRAVITVHLRSEGYELEESVDQIIRLAEKTGATFVISHFKAAGTKNWDKYFPTMLKIAEARKRGASIYLTAYPYTAAQTELGSLLPEWFYTDPERKAKLQDETIRERIRAAFAEREGADPGGLIISGVATRGNKEWQGKIIRDFARSRELDDIDGLLKLLEEEDFKVTVIAFGQNTLLMQETLKQNFTIPVSDTILELSDSSHPRAYGAFPTYLKSLVIDSYLLPLGEAISKITALPAEVYGIKDRGEIREGAHADIFIWDPAEYQAMNSYEKPSALTQGARFVFVNGKLVIDDGEITGERPGKVLKKSNKR